MDIENGTVFYFDIASDMPLLQSGGYKKDDDYLVMFNNGHMGFGGFCTVEKNCLSTVNFDSEYVFLSGEKVLLHDKPTSIEKIALSLLHWADTGNPFLYAYTQALLENQDESREFEEFIRCYPKPGPEKNKTLVEMYPELRNEKFCEFMLTGRETPYVSNELAKKNPYHIDSRYDSVIYNLACSIAEYRELGRPEGDCIPFSLEESIVEFHKRRVLMLYRRIDELEGMD